MVEIFFMADVFKRGFLTTKRFNERGAAPLSLALASRFWAGRSFRIPRGSDPGQEDSRTGQSDILAGLPG